MDEVETEGVCDRCGAATKIRFGDLWICESCYAAAASCCTEFEVGEEDEKTG